LEKLKKSIINVKIYINNVMSNYSSKEAVWMICLTIFPLYIFKLIFYLLSVFCIATSGYRAVRDIRQELFDKVQRLPLSYFYKEKTGLVMSRIVNDAEVVAAVISSNLRDAIINFFYVFTHLLILLYLNADLLISALLVIPVVILPVTLFTKKISKSTEKFQERMGDLNAHLQETISGIKIIRSFNTEQKEFKKFNEINHKVYHRTFKGQYYLQMAPSLVELTSSVVVLGFFALGASLIATKRFTQGEFMTFLLTLLFLLRPLTQLSQMVGKVTQAISAGKRIFEIIDKPIDTESTDGIILENKIADKISLNNISFAYPGTSNPVLKNINLEFKMGESYALVGSSGSGKSTLVDLIPRFFDSTEGEISIDQHKLKDINLKSLRKKIGIVTQEIFLFHGTISDNISYGKENVTRKEIIRAARLANAHDFISKMEEGYDTVLGTRGLNLSGGQRQRIVIARALLRNPEILILDEATSALDIESERLVNQALIRLLKNRTTIVIAHRLSTVRHIKNIIVLEDGIVREMGDHESLINKGGSYKKLHDLAFS
jgi:ATP-binding cassette subfamily B protein